MIIGTAGHIDHGKTTLVRALTGIDTDRLPQEKARGISIELGYAYTPLASGTSLGFIDVPGHERFVHTMLAGACGIDYALLVVAADDGVMPQTVEHAVIIDLLSIRCGAVVVTKADRVDAARVATVLGEIDALLAGTGLAGSPVFVVDARSGADGQMVALRAELERAAWAMGVRNRAGLFRLCIDRAFTLAGHGTIVTGTAESGEIGVGDSVTLLPAGDVVRVRSLHAQNRSSARGGAGDRLALNIAGIDAAALQRGDWLADARGMAITDRVDARLSLLAGTPALAPYAPVHLHYGAGRTMAHVVGLDTERVSPGRPAWVQLVFDAPAAVPAGSRFILRNAQANRTIGGGLFLDVAAPARRRRSDGRRRLVDALEATLGSGDLTTLLAVAPSGFSRAALMRATSRSVPDPLPPGIRSVAGGSADDDTFVIADDCWAALRARTMAALQSFHAEHPADPGPDAALLRSRVDAQLPRLLWRAVVNSLVEDNLIARAGGWLQMPGHGAELSARDELQAAALLERLYGGAYDPPWARDLARETGLSEERVRGLLAGLGRSGRAHPVVPDLYYDARRVAELAAIFSELAAGDACVDAATFRDRLAIGRKRSIQILEFFDRVGYTRRRGLGRILRTSAGWGAAR